MEEDLEEGPPPPAARQLPGLTRMGRKKGNSCEATGEHFYQEICRWGSGNSTVIKAFCVKCGKSEVIG